MLKRLKHLKFAWFDTDKQQTFMFSVLSFGNTQRSEEV